MQISNGIFTMKGWTEKKIILRCFLRLASFVFMKNFRFLSPALHVLSKKMPIFYHICVKKYFSTKIFTVLHQSKKELLDLDQNWAKTRHLLFKTWKSSISMDSPIVHWLWGYGFFNSLWVIELLESSTIHGLGIVAKKRDPGILDPELFSGQIRKVEARLGKLAKIRKVETD